MPKIKLHWQILIAMGFAVLVGIVFDKETVLLGMPLIGVLKFIGTMFLSALKMLIVPLVLSSIICGVYGMGAGGKANLGKLGGKTLGFYMCSSLVAILIGLLVVNLIVPGTIDGEPAGSRLNLSSETAIQEQLSRVEGRGLGDVAEVFLRMVPSNIIQAAAQGEMLGLITFGILFGFFMIHLKDAKQREAVGNFFQGVFQIMMSITLFVMKFAPIGVFGLVANTIIMTGFDAFAPLLAFFFSVVIALALHAFVAMPLLLRYLAGVNPLLHFRAVAPALLTAFSTASSSGTLPVTMECVEKNAKVSNRTTSFVLPLGATVNMDGTALYECVAAMFIAQAYGLDLTLGTQFTIVVVALLTSIGVAGIPAASLVAITVILGAIGLPLEGIGLLLVTDRILDMLRTSVNVLSDSCCAIVIAKSEGEEGVLATPAVV